MIVSYSAVGCPCRLGPHAPQHDTGRVRCAAPLGGNLQSSGCRHDVRRGVIRSNCIPHNRRRVNCHDPAPLTCSPSRVNRSSRKNDVASVPANESTGKQFVQHKFFPCQEFDREAHSRRLVSALRRAHAPSSDVARRARRNHGNARNSAAFKMSCARSARPARCATTRRIGRSVAPNRVRIRDRPGSERRARKWMDCRTRKRHF